VFSKFLEYRLYFWTTEHSGCYSSCSKTFKHIGNLDMRSFVFIRWSIGSMTITTIKTLYIH